MRSAWLLGIFGLGVLLSLPGILTLSFGLLAPSDGSGPWIVPAISLLIGACSLVPTWRRMHAELRCWAVLLAFAECFAILVVVPNGIAFVGLCRTCALRT